MLILLVIWPAQLLYQIMNQCGGYGALMLEDDEPVLAHGTMGYEGQLQTQVAMVTRLVGFGCDVRQAIEASCWLMSRTWSMESRDLWLQSRISDEVARELRLRGHPVKMAGQWDGTLGHAQAIRIDRRNGLFEGGADLRGDSAEMGYQYLPVWRFHHATT